MTAVEWLFQGRHIRAWMERGERPEVIATFCHMYHARDGFDAVVPGSWITARGYGHLRIQTAANDWYQNPDLEPAQERLAELAPAIGPVRLYGNSMGAMGGLMFGAALQAISGFLISPSLPRRYTNGMALFGSAFGPDYTVLYDPRIPVDVWHAQTLRDLLPGTVLVALEGGGHPATGMIRRGGRYNEVRNFAVGEGADPAMLAALHARVTARLAA